ncbi:MAG: coproporphyrinogen dehydrogenase HemZ, partial [Eubacterium sp.]|nr:coproporphyrinogen dehydrogenase HemZ [Eubacterium sp.]
TLSEIESMNPESLTVHSLAIKRAADLNQEYNLYKNKISLDMDGMISLATKKSEEMGLKPYYLYRQKNIAGNLENTGFAKPGYECVYNVLIMEEKLDTFAAGAGAITRLLNIEDGETTRIDRVENVKNIDEYIERLDEMLERKQLGVDGRILDF